MWNVDGINIRGIKCGITVTHMAGYAMTFIDKGVQ